jgi:hypothetical protein
MTKGRLRARRRNGGLASVETDRQALARSSSGNYNPPALRFNCEIGLRLHTCSFQVRAQGADKVVRRAGLFISNRAVHPRPEWQLVREIESPDPMGR